MTQNKFKKIFVGGLPPQTTESDMREYFSKYGDVCDVVAMRDKTGNKSRGFGFVVFKEADSVDRCQAERPHQLLGKIVDTKRAMPKEESINPDIHCNSKRIFIGGLRRFFTEDDLRNYFKNFGQIIDCTIKRDSVSGASRGFAFITFTDRDIVDKVILSKPHSIRHCIVDVKKAMSPEELRQIDDTQNHQVNNNHSDYDEDYQKVYKVTQEPEEETAKIKEKTIKKTTKRSQSYPQTEVPNYAYYMYPGDVSGGGVSPYSFEGGPHQAQQVPLIWMSVQQCPDGLILTPVGTDLYGGGYPCFFSPSSMPGQYGYQQHLQQFFPAAALTDDPRRPALPANPSDGHGRGGSPANTSNGTIDVSDLQKVLPKAAAADEDNNSHSADDYASEETAFGSPTSDSVC